MHFFFQRICVFSFKIVDKLKTIPIFAYRLTTLKSKYYGENRTVLTEQILEIISQNARIPI